MRIVGVGAGEGEALAEGLADGTALAAGDGDGAALGTIEGLGLGAGLGSGVAPVASKHAIASIQRMPGTFGARRQFLPSKIRMAPSRPGVVS